MVGIVDYNVGNLQSVINAFFYLGVDARLENNPENLKNYDRLILPGVGAFGDAMRSLESTHMKEAVCEYTKSGKYILGICLGMQLLFQSSSEFGIHKGLGLVDGEVVGFDKSSFSRDLKVPHMGWNILKKHSNSALFKDTKDELYLYFVHSFHVRCKDEYVIGKTEYGYEFVSAVQYENVFGFQPHPEKSHSNGLKILENFTKL